jgi:hypothetical protein
MSKKTDIFAQLGKFLADQAAASTGSNSSASSSNNNESKKTRQLDPVTVIGRVAKNNFKKLPVLYQTAEGKRQAVNLAIANDKKHRYPDAARYWDDNEVEGRLLDRAQDLKKFCEDEHLNYVAVKQHLVIEGRGVMKDIVLNGIENYKTLILKFGDLLYDREKECKTTRTGVEEKQEGANA